MSAKHTPGPWQECNVGWVVGADGRTVCSLYATNVPEQPRANARLIAAAPEMLAFLEQIALSLYINDYGYWQVAKDSAIERIDEIIKKATGEQA